MRATISTFWKSPDANLSRAMHWLNVSYGAWVNRRHRRHGPLLQGRFGAFAVEEEAGWQELARYVHLNPVRAACLGLSKSARAASRIGVGAALSRTWKDSVDRHGDWGSDAALRLGRRTGRMRLAHLGELAGGLDYAVVSKAMARFGRRLLLDVALRTRLAAIEKQLSTRRPFGQQGPDHGAEVAF